MIDAKTRHTPGMEAGLLIVACLDLGQWEALRVLAAAHVAGNLSLDAWRTATGAILESARRRAEEEGNFL